MNSLVRYDKTINSHSTIELFKQIEAAHPKANDIYVICDNARYYRSTLIKDCLKGSTITLVFLPPYSPHLNLIERYWKFFKKKILYGIYYETLMTEKFQMIQSSSNIWNCRHYNNFHKLKKQMVKIYSI